MAMRLFEFECVHCGDTFEELVRSVDDAPELVCPSCGETGARKILSSFAVRGGRKAAAGFTSAAASGCGSSGFS